MSDTMMLAALIGGITGGAGVLLLSLMRKPVVCANCGTQQPKFRKPNSLNQALFGGFTCNACGAELTALGRLKE
ncbi:MAG: hypothetical protein AAGF20_07990 [Pseudomonadota bacterium]